MRRLILCLALVCAPLLAQPPTWQVGSRILPTTPTNPCGQAYFGQPVCGQTLHLDALIIVNTSAVTATVTITDASTNCSGGGCPLFAATIAGGTGTPTTYSVPLLGERANMGFLWSATSTGVNAWIAGH